MVHCKTEKTEGHTSLEKAAKGPVQARTPCWDLRSTQNINPVGTSKALKV